MKRRELENKLKSIGFSFLCHGGNHGIWVRGNEKEEIPRHAEINEILAKKILKRRGY